MKGVARLKSNEDLFDSCARQFQSQAPPQANLGCLIHDESRGAGHLVVNSVPVSRAIANNKKLASHHPIVISYGTQKSMVILDIEKHFRP